MSTIRIDVSATGGEETSAALMGIAGAFDTRASLTIGPLTIFDDGEIRVAEGARPADVASGVLAAVQEGQAHAARAEREACAVAIEKFAKGAAAEEALIFAASIVRARGVPR